MTISNLWNTISSTHFTLQYSEPKPPARRSFSENTNIEPSNLQPFQMFRKKPSFFSLFPLFRNVLSCLKTH